MTGGNLFKPILDLIIESMPRDNLLNSACLEFFEYIRSTQTRSLVSHLVENHRALLEQITYVDLFQVFINRYDNAATFDPTTLDSSFLDTEGGDTPKRPETGRGRFENESGIRDLDPAEEEYFNTSDDDEDDKKESHAAEGTQSNTNGASPPSKPLVDYPSDEENENVEPGMNSGLTKPDVDHDLPRSKVVGRVQLGPNIFSSAGPPPPERLSEKRRREDEDDNDELSKLLSSKRRNSSSSVGSVGSVGSNASNTLRRKKSFTSHGGSSAAKPNKIAISVSSAIKTGDSGGAADSGS